MTQSGNVWWNEDKAAFSIDFKYETPDSCTVTMNTKNPNGYSDKATSPGNVNPTFYWDNSRENVFKLYFKEKRRRRNSDTCLRVLLFCIPLSGRFITA